MDAMSGLGELFTLGDQNVKVVAGVKGFGWDN